jgi:RNA ligase
LRLDNSYSTATTVKEVVALPFPKFFNVGEVGMPTTPLIEAREKVDGVLGILYRHDDQIKIATRGSFESDQALWATEFIKRWDLSQLPVNYTLLFEIVYPGSKIVIDYKGKEDLILLAVLDRYSMIDFMPERIKQIAHQFKFTTPWQWDITSVDQALKMAKTLSADKEGWVLRFADSSRFKVKGEEYKLIHRLIMQISYKNVIEAMRDCKIDDWLEKIPEEYLDEVKRWIHEAKEYIRDMLQTTTLLFNSAPKDSRKDFAVYVTQFCPDVSDLMFALYDGKDILPLLYKRLLKGQQ